MRGPLIACVMAGMFGILGTDLAAGQGPVETGAGPSGVVGGTTVNTSPVISEADLDVPVEKAWSVFSTDEGYKLLGVAQAKVDFRVGGKLLTHYDPKGVLGDEGSIEQTIIAYEPMRMVAFRITRPPKGFPFMAAYKDVWSVATITDLGGGRSHLRLAMCGYTADEESQKMRAFFDQGNAWVMEKLKKNLAGQGGTPEKKVDSAGASDPLAPVVAEAVMAAMPQDVWSVWTTGAGMSSVVPDAKIELSVGGAYELYFSKDAPEGERGSEGCRVLSFEPTSMLSFSWNAPPKFSFARTQRTWVVVHIDPYGPHACKVTLKQMGFAEQAKRSPEHAEEWKQVRAYFDQAWPQVLKGMQEKFAGRASK